MAFNGNGYFCHNCDIYSDTDLDIHSPKSEYGCRKDLNLLNFQREKSAIWKSSKDRAAL
jgi:hypothetical protein